MEERDRAALAGALEEFLNERMERLILSGPAEKNGLQKVKIHPVMLRGELAFQAEEQRGTQAFHRNMDRDRAAAYVTEMLDGIMRQMELSSAS